MLHSRASVPVPAHEVGAGTMSVDPVVIATFLCAVAVAGLLGVAVFDTILRPGFRKLALRNILRRRAEAVLVVVGASLATAIIAASLLVGSTFATSIRDGARTRLGPIDHIVELTPGTSPETILGVLGSPPIKQVDGLLATSSVTTAVTSTVGGQTRSVPRATITAVDFAAARGFGGDPQATGFVGLGATPRDGEIVVGQRMAAELSVGVGDQVVAHFFGTEQKLRVTKIAPEVGVAGSSDAFIAPTALTTAFARSVSPGREPPVAQIAVSNQGGVFDGVHHDAAVTAALHQRLGAPGTNGRVAAVTPVKSDLLERAGREGNGLQQLFSGVGTFSVLAGVLLLVNLFVMLAEERRRELGLARAIGLRRVHLIRIFTLEGTLYAIAATLLGSVLGVGLARLITGRAATLVGATETNFALRFVVPLHDLALAALLGAGLSLATAWITSFRIARLDIVRALHEVPEPPSTSYRLGATGVAASLVVGGAALGAYGLHAIVPMAAVIGPPLASIGLLGILRPRYGRRFATGVASVVTLVWCVGVFTFNTDIVNASTVPDFVVQGLIMVAAAVGLSTALDRAWTLILVVLTRSGKGLATRLGLAYPLDRLFRTSMLLAMYALIIFTLTFLSLYGAMFQRHSGALVDQLRGGADAVVDSNASDPLQATTLARQPDVAHVAVIDRGRVQVTTALMHDPASVEVSGINDAFTANGAPALSARAASQPSDRAAFQTLQRNPATVIVAERFLAESGLQSPDRGHIGVGDTITMRNPRTGTARQLTVIATTGLDFTHARAYLSRATLTALLGSDAAPTRAVVTFKPGVDVAARGAQLESTFVRHGAVVTSFRQFVDDNLAIELGFFRLIQSYMSVGMIVGIAGMAVVMVRAARERRRQVGMLRTIGITARTVRHAFLIEASFIALQGIATGLGLGMLVAYQMLSGSAALGGSTLPFVVPWKSIVGLATVPFAASLAAALLPASQAAKVHPAAALRLPD